MTRAVLGPVSGSTMFYKSFLSFGILQQTILSALLMSVNNGQFIGNALVTPLGVPANGGYVFAREGALWWKGGLGNETRVALA